MKLTDYIKPKKIVIKQKTERQRKIKDLVEGLIEDLAAGR